MASSKESRSAAADVRAASLHLPSLLAAALPGLYLLLTSTTTLVRGFWPYDVKRMAEFALLLALFALPALDRRIRTAFSATLAATPRWVALTLGAVFAWGSLSAVVHARSPLHLANSLSDVALLLSLVLAVYVIAACRRVAGRPFDQVAVGLLTLTGLTVGVQELLGAAAAHAAGVEFSFRLSLMHFSWPRFYNQVQSWTVPVLAALPLLFARRPLARVLCVIALGLQWYIILMTGARGSFVSLAIAFLFAALFLPKLRGTLLRWQVSGLILGAVLYGAVLISFETSIVDQGAATDAPTPAAQVQSPDAGFYGNEGAGTSSFKAQSIGRPLLDPMGRNWMWSAAFYAARSHPLLGIGPMNFACTSPLPYGHPHNFPLQLAAEWGFPVVIAVMVLFLALFWRAGARIRHGLYGDKGSNRLAGLLLTGVLAAALHACLSGVMVMPASQVTGLLVVGLLVGLRGVPGKRDRAAWRAPAAFVPGLLLCLALLALGAQELRTMEARSARLAPLDSMWPRMWQDANVCRFYVPANDVRN